MNNTIKKTRGEKRAETAQRKKLAPRGGTKAGQIAHIRARRGYVGLPKGLKPRALGTRL